MLSLAGHSFCNLFIIVKDKFHSKAADSESDAVIVQIMSCAFIFKKRTAINISSCIGLISFNELSYMSTQTSIHESILF